MSSRNFFPSTRFTIAVVAIVLMVFVGKSQWGKTQQARVLGVQQLLADKGGSSGENKSSGGDHGGSGSSSEGSKGGSSGESSSGGSNGSRGGGGSSSSGGGGGGGETRGGEEAARKMGVSESTIIDCVGPDGKHSQTTLKSCADFNKAWNNSNFSFTVVGSSQVVPAPKPQEFIAPQPEEIKKGEKKERTERLEVSANQGKGRVNIAAEGVEVELEQEDNELRVKAKRADGTEVELEDEALEDINDVLEKEDVKIGTAAGRFTLKRGEVEAETDFPLSVNVATRQLTVLTPSGAKTVAVLPDQAVQNLLFNNIFDRVEAEASPGATKKVVLAETENQVVFVVKGLTDKRLLGFIPVSVRKTVYVSAQSGELLRTDEDILNRILETLSF